MKMFRLFIFWFCLAVGVETAIARPWTSIDGRSVEGEAVNKTKETVIIRIPNGGRRELPLNKLVAKDREFVKNWTPKRPFKAPEDAVFYDGSWYGLILNEGVSRPVANAEAERLGGHLAWVKNAEIQKLVHGLAKGLQVWIGGSDKETEGVWKWGDGERFDYTYWAKGEPKNYRGREHYVHLMKGGRWNDNDEHSGAALVGFIVQWDP